MGVKSSISLWLFVCILTIVWCNMLGPGTWVVRNVEMCPDNDDYESPVNITRKKLNRTHDGFTAIYELATDITNQTGVEITIFKQVDGGWKLFHELKSDNVCDFCKNHSKENFEQVLIAGNQPSDCPIAQGSHKVENYVINYEKLPEQCVYGVFKGIAYLIEAGRKVTCIVLYMECLEKVPTG